MRNLRDASIDCYRDRSNEVVKIYGGIGDDTCGVFVMPSPIDGRSMMVIASSALGWDHVSVRHVARIPNWPEMEFIKRLFFLEDETCMQLHVKPVEHINNHPNVLHIWRPNDGREIPLPPSAFV